MGFVIQPLLLSRKRDLLLEGIATWRTGFNLIEIFFCRKRDLLLEGIATSVGNDDLIVVVGRKRDLLLEGIATEAFILNLPKNSP